MPCVINRIKTFSQNAYVLRQEENCLNSGSFVESIRQSFANQSISKSINETLKKILIYKTNICTLDIHNNKLLCLLLHISAKLCHLQRAYNPIGLWETLKCNLLQLVHIIVLIITAKFKDVDNINIIYIYMYIVYGFVIVYKQPILSVIQYGYCSSIICR